MNLPNNILNSIKKFLKKHKNNIFIFLIIAAAFLLFLSIDNNEKSHLNIDSSNIKLKEISSTSMTTTTVTTENQASTKSKTTKTTKQKTTKPKTTATTTKAQEDDKIIYITNDDDVYTNPMMNMLHVKYDCPSLRNGIIILKFSKAMDKGLVYCPDCCKNVLYKPPEDTMQKTS